VAGATHERPERRPCAATACAAVAMIRHALVQRPAMIDCSAMRQDAADAGAAAGCKLLRIGEQRWVQTSKSDW